MALKSSLNRCSELPDCLGPFFQELGQDFTKGQQPLTLIAYKVHGFTEEMGRVPKAGQVSPALALESFVSLAFSTNCLFRSPFHLVSEERGQISSSLTQQGQGP